MVSRFPLSFELAPAMDGTASGAAGRFLVASMYTASHAQRARRLRDSCEQFGLPYALYELPAIHKSISLRGTPDPGFTKPNFIRSLLERYRRPILYLDADCVFRAPPALIDELARKGTSFAAYNWLADDDNDAFYPIDVRHGGRLIQRRFFDYSHRIGWHSTGQLIVSGCVQLYDTSAAAAALLAMWHETIGNYPEAEDDRCLAFAFNNGGAQIAGLRCAWLPKEYARVAWWIFTRPVIDHPELPGVGGSGHQEIPRSAELRVFYAERCEPVPERFAETSVIDVQDRLLYAMSDGVLSLMGPLELELWISDECRAPSTFDVREIRSTPG